MHAKSAGGGVEIPVHGKVDDVQSGEVGGVRSVVVIAFEQSVVAAAQDFIRMSKIVSSLLESGFPVGVSADGFIVMRAFLGCRDSHHIVPRVSVIVPRIVFRFFPCVVAGRAVIVCAAVNHFHRAGADFAEHEEGAAAAFCLRFCRFRRLLELRQEIFVERETRDVSCGVDTEAVNAHLDEA